MRKIIASNYVTLDGFFAGPNGEIDWFVWDEETEKYSRDLIGSIDTILFGRVTYEMMASFWPTATTEDPIITEAMNSLPKVVFSRTVDKVEWSNSRLAKGNMADEVKRMKQQQGRDMVIYGSGSIVQALTHLGLIDEYRIFVNPIVLGEGKPQFMGDRLKLKLQQTRTFACGVVLLHYQPDEQ